MSERRATPNLYSVPAGAPFLDTLAEALLAGRLDLPVDAGDPATLARTTIYLPTRRAARAFAATLLARSGRRALLMPRIVPLGDPAEGEALDMIDAEADAEAAAGAQPIDPLTRRFLLADQLQRAAVSGAGLNALTAGAAFALAADLAAILDGLQAEDIAAERLMRLDAARFESYWANTARFLAILGAYWDGILAERGAVDPVAWRNGLIRRQIARLKARPPDSPVIVAGSTGSLSLTAELIGAVARHRAGAVVLPDVDPAIDDDTWRTLTATEASLRDRAASHPQAQLARLIGGMGAPRDGVRTLKHDAAGGAGAAARRQLAHEALALAEATERWRALPERIGAETARDAFAAVRIVEAADDRREAEICAVAIREALATGDGTVALVTPDRTLAERTAIELRHWGIGVDDSAGQPLTRTPAGALLGLLAGVMAEGLSSAAVIALLAHERVALGLDPEALARGRAALEIGALRGAPEASTPERLLALARGVPERVADRHAPPPLARLTVAEQAGAHDLAARLAMALAPLDALAPDGLLDGAVAALREALSALTRDDSGAATAFAGPDGEALDQLLGELQTACAERRGAPADLATICRGLMAERVVRAAGHGHPRVAILGLLEARLISHDLVILGGLNEGVWPPKATTDPLLNRAMRAELGLSSPERRIGQSAHDFIQAFAAPAVILARSLKTGSAPTLASRFWQRLQAVTPEDIWRRSLDAGARLGALAALLDAPGKISPRRRPAPRPPASRQPRQFSVSEVETLFRDPYAIHARRILGLAPLPPTGLTLEAGDRGDLLHAVMERFGRAWPTALPPDPEAALLAVGEAVFAPVRGEVEVEAFWWPRFRALIPAIANWERTRREAAGRIAVELRAKAMIRLPDGAEVALTARADRIEGLHDGRLAILDFKTGAFPTAKQQAAGLAPQLPLEAALATRTAYRSVNGDADAPGDSLGPAEAAEAAYVALKPGPETLKVSPFGKEDCDLAAEAEQHLDGFRALVADFRAGARAFTPRFAPQFMRHEGDYDRLARVKEWSVLGDAEDGGET